MNPDRLRDLLERVRRGEVDPEARFEQLARLPFVDVPGARVDTHRALRSGLPEVVFAPGKTRSRSPTSRTRCAERARTCS
jgi:NCAIR mutase (PurE)-related protein